MISDKGAESSKFLSWIGTIKIRIKGINSLQAAFVLDWDNQDKGESSVSAE